MEPSWQSKVVRPRLDVYSALAGVGLVAMVASAGDGGVVLCPYRRCTGGFCPGCGATRAANRLMFGDVAAAWSRHPMVVILAMQALAMGAAVLSDRQSWLRRHQTAIVSLNVALLIAIWVVRSTTGSIPTPTIFG